MNAEIVAALEERYPPESQDFGVMFFKLFDELMEIADRGEEAPLQARIINANLSLARAGHGRIELFVIPGPPLSVGSRNVDTMKRLGRLQEVVDGKLKK